MAMRLGSRAKGEHGVRIWPYKIFKLEQEWFSLILWHN
jgi:hypothetical protein